MEILKGFNLLLRFLLELFALAAFGYWGARQSDAIGLKLALGIGLPLLGAIAWAIFASPKAAVKLPLAGRLAFEIVFFGLASLGLYASGQITYALVLAGLYIINRVLILAWKQ